MIVLVARYQCKLGMGEKVQHYLNQMKLLVDEREKGCIVYEANRSQQNQDHFLLYEKYTTEAALNAHRETPHFIDIIQTKVIPLLEKREVELYSSME